jgi:hypothetical protein
VRSTSQARKAMQMPCRWNPVRIDAIIDNELNVVASQPVPWICRGSPDWDVSWPKQERCRDSKAEVLAGNLELERKAN